MKERPILFNGDMVRAILDGRKTQTRRLVKFPDWFDGDAIPRQHDGYCDVEQTTASDIQAHCKSPYGHAGDRLWVREKCRAVESVFRSGSVEYFADESRVMVTDTEESVKRFGDLRWHNDYPAHSVKIRDVEMHGKWVPSIHMPRWASRITLEITNVRVERVQDISEIDAKAEGVNGGCLKCGNPAPCGCENPSTDYRDAFAWLWNSIYEKRGHGWDVNPWVWVYEFKRIKK